MSIRAIGKLVILVVPCQAVVDEEYTLTDCVRQMFEQFTYGEGACAKQLKSCLQQEIHALETLKELADLLRAYDAEPEEPGETVSDEPAVPEETVILETIEEEADQIKTESANIAADAEYMRSQLWEDMRHELEKELREQIREETRRELETELRESIRAELEEEQAQAETLRAARNRYIFAYPAGPFNGAETSNEAYEKLLEKYLTDFEPAYEEEFEKKVCIHL